MEPVEKSLLKSPIKGGPKPFSFCTREMEPKILAFCGSIHEKCDEKPLYQTLFKTVSDP